MNDAGKGNKDNMSDELQRSPEASQFYEAIGALVTAHNTMEQELRSFVSHLIPLGGLLLEGERTTVMVSAAKRVLARLYGSERGNRSGTRASRIPPEEEQHIHGLLDAARKLDGQRNDIVHALWIHSEDGGLTGYSTKRSGTSVLPSPASLEEITAIGQDLMDLTTDLFIAGWNMDARAVPPGEPGPPVIDRRPPDQHTFY